MGQAKRRGTFEERLAQSAETKKRRQEEADERECQRQEERARRIAAMPPEQRREELVWGRRPRTPLALLAALSLIPSR